MPEIFKPKYIPKEPHLEEPVESQQGANPESSTPKGSFIVGQEVTVGRSLRDAEGNVIKGQVMPEAGWKVKQVDSEAGTVVVSTPDGAYEKTYSVDRLRSFNPLPVSEVAAIETSVDAHTEALERKTERHLSPEEFEELGEPAVEVVVEPPNPWSKEAADQRRREQEPTRENPRMFDIHGGLVRLYEFPIGNGRMAEGIAAGVFSNEKGENVALIVPNDQFRRETGYQGKYVEVPFSQLEHKVAARPESNPYAEAARQIVTSAEVPKAMPETSPQKSTETSYDDWLNGDIEGSVEDAAVRPALSEEEKLTRQRRAADAQHNANNAYKRQEMQR
tara:strand:+ start:103 stop:1101 length:999 start_codon:yes stop_codon:yes gene_type:complete